MYEHLERLFQGLAPTSEYLKGVYYELADEFFKQLRQQIEITQTELRESEQLEIYYHAQGEEPILVSKIGPRSRRRPLSATQPHPTTSLGGIAWYCNEP